MVRTESLTKQYGKITALDRCTLSIPQGKVYGLLGPNGSGKTTLIRLLLGFLRPTSGQATIDGLDSYDRSLDIRRRVAYLPGELRIFRQLRGHQVLDFFTGIRPGCNRRQLENYANRFELDLTRRVSAMSTGMRQKLGLAMTLAAPTPWIILDEPTANLDPNVRDIVLTMIGEANHQGRTVILSSHVLSEVESVCEHVAILNHGQVIHVQDMHSICQHHRIRVRLTGPMPPIPGFLDNVELIKPSTAQKDNLEIRYVGDLADLLWWLATLPVEQVQINSVGLKSIYDRELDNSSTLP